MPTTSSVPAVARALLMLEALDRSARGLNIAELARSIRIPRSSAHTIALTLERSGYLTRDPSQHHCLLTAKAYLLGRETMNYERLANAARLPMRQLSTQLRLTSHMAVLDHHQATYIQKVQRPGLLNFDTYVGKRTNLHCTAVGKVLLSYAPENYRNRCLERGTFARYTINTITQSSMLREELNKVRAQGYAIDNAEEELNIRCIAVPVLTAWGEVVAALSISGTMAEMRDNQVASAVSQLRQTAALVVRRLRHLERGDAEF